MLGLCFCARAFSSCGERGPLFIVVCGPLTIAVSPVAEHRLQTRRLSTCGSRAQLLRGMWDLPRPGLEPVSPALAGRFSTTAPPGKPGAVFWVGFFILSPVSLLTLNSMVRVLQPGPPLPKPMSNQLRSGWEMCTLIACSPTILSCILFKVS